MIPFNLHHTAVAIYDFVEITNLMKHGNSVRFHDGVTGNILAIEGVDGCGMCWNLTIRNEDARVGVVKKFIRTN
jgi:hypothetical protein